ncbi:MAG: acetate--CoA ligase family protein [Gammaproteobacteria bacterium]|nr:acetate--CoA ligase family protein [Gammaproteobacteria bacterium]
MTPDSRTPAGPGTRQSPPAPGSNVPRARIAALFQPRSVALVGASEAPGALGTVVLDNLLAAGFQGPLHLVNPRHREIRGRAVLASVQDLPDEVDVAIVVTPATTVPAVIADCGERGVRAAIVMSAGFREVGADGLAIEREMLASARRHGLRILGPNCLGVIRTDLGFNGTFSAGNALPGRIGIISQSGALCTAILDWAQVNSVGFSSVISTGIGADVDFGEMLDFLAKDPATDSIMLYVEGIHRARPFMNGLRAAARVKPVVVMKTGRHAEGSRAARSHTGALVGSDAVFDAALRRAGVLRVASFADFFSAAAILATGRRTTGRRLAIVTNAGGPGVLAADHAADRGIPLAEFTPATLASLGAAMPAYWSRGNPVDVLGDADASRFEAAVSACLADPGVDAVVTILTPQAMTAPEEVAHAVIRASAGSLKPLLASWMGEVSVASSRALFRAERIPTLRTPEAAVDAFAAIGTYGEAQRQLQQVPEPPASWHAPDIAAARLVIERVLAERRTVLTLPESRTVLAAFDVPLVPSLVARTAEQAATIAQELGFPVVVKILSPDITHKSDVGGVRLGLTGARQVSEVFREMMADAAAALPAARLDGVVIQPMAQREHGREVMIGVARDEVFGPVLSFGLGGTLVEVLGDSAVALPPLNPALAEDLVARTRAARWLEPFRGAPAADRDAIVRLLLRVSAMACELPWIHELDLNPVFAGPDGVTVVDARIVVGALDPGARPYDHLAIHPEPGQRPPQDARGGPARNIR